MRVLTVAEHNLPIRVVTSNKGSMGMIRLDRARRPPTSPEWL